MRLVQFASTSHVTDVALFGVVGAGMLATAYQLLYWQHLAGNGSVLARSVKDLKNFAISHLRHRRFRVWESYARLEMQDGCIFECQQDKEGSQAGGTLRAPLQGNRCLQTLCLQYSGLIFVEDYCKLLRVTANYCGVGGGAGLPPRCAVICAKS